MAGLGRRTHYRKHLTDSVLHDFPEPNPPYSRLAKIVGTRGSNQFDVILSGSDGQQQQQEWLAILPTKFRKLVWLKRNDFVIVETADNVEPQHKPTDEHDETSTTTTTNNVNDTAGIRCMIAHILYHDQIKHLISKGLWPGDDPQFVVDDRKLQEVANQQILTPQADEDGIVYDHDHYSMPQNDYDDTGGNEHEDNEEEQLSSDDPLLFVNTNRIARLTVQDSSSSDEEE